ncbi:MAG TPA: hypothetical protein VGB68_01445, partial [Pyrinomonadaceae bacterium]
MLTLCLNFTVINFASKFNTKIFFLLEFEFFDCRSRLCYSVKDNLRGVDSPKGFVEAVSTIAQVESGSVQR